MIKKNADGSAEISFKLTEKQVQMLTENPEDVLELRCGSDTLIVELDKNKKVWLAFSWE